MKMFSTPPANSKNFIIQSKNRGGLLFKSIEQKNKRGLLFKVKIEKVYYSKQLKLIHHMHPSFELMLVNQNQKKLSLSPVMNHK